MVEEINSNSGESRAINDFPLSNTVKDLKIAIARATGQVSEWASIMTFFVGEEMEDSKLWGESGDGIQPSVHPRITNGPAP